MKKLIITWLAITFSIYANAERTGIAEIDNKPIQSKVIEKIEVDNQTAQSQTVYLPDQNCGPGCKMISRKFTITPHTKAGLILNARN